MRNFFIYCSSTYNIHDPAVEISQLKHTLEHHTIGTLVQEGIRQRKKMPPALHRDCYNV